MTPEELMIPRYKVIGTYPACEGHMVYMGDILTDNGKTAVLNQDGIATCAFQWELFPNIFKPLEWWEERSESDMPGWVRVQESLIGQYPEVMKVDKWKMHKTVPILFSGHNELTAWYTEPATLKQYLDYINKQKV